MVFVCCFLHTAPSLDVKGRIEMSLSLNISKNMVAEQVYKFKKKFTNENLY
jgi:hypothetical protein